MKQVIIRNGNTTTILGTNGEDTIVKALKLLASLAVTAEERIQAESLLETLSGVGRQKR